MTDPLNPIPLTVDAEPADGENYLLITEEVREGGKTVFVVTGTVSKTADYLDLTFGGDTMAEALDTARWLARKFAFPPIYVRQP